MNEEEPDRHMIKAIVILLLYLVVFVALTFSTITMITSRIPDIDYMFNNTGMYVLAIGIPMAIFAGLTAYFDKGELHRMFLGIVAASLMGVYFIAVIRSLDIGFKGDEYSFFITMPGIILLIAGATILKGTYFLAEYYIYNKKEKQQKQEVQYY